MPIPQKFVIPQRIICVPIPLQLLQLYCSQAKKWLSNEVEFSLFVTFVGGMNSSMCLPRDPHSLQGFVDIWANHVSAEEELGLLL